MGRPWALQRKSRPMDGATVEVMTVTKVLTLIGTGLSATSQQRRNLLGQQWLTNG